MPNSFIPGTDVSTIRPVGLCSSSLSRLNVKLIYPGGVNGASVEYVDFDGVTGDPDR